MAIGPEHHRQTNKSHWTLRWKRAQRRNLAFRLVLAALIVGGLLSFLLFQRGRFFISVDCLAAYGLAKSAEDSARVDRMAVFGKRVSHAITCGDQRRDNFPPYDRSRR
jgi:hypothetical protein